MPEGVEGWIYGRLDGALEVPLAWRLVRLTDVARLESGHTPARTVSSYWNGSVRWLSLHDTRNLEAHEIVETKLCITPLGLANSSARLLPAGTVALSRTATVGKCVILGREMATSQDFACYVPGPHIRAKYLMHLFRFMQPVWRAFAGGSTHQTVYMPVFENLQTLLPPLPEQQRIAEILDTVDDAIRKTEEIIAKLKQVKQGLLHDLLTRGIDDNGELRDPDRHPEQFKDSPLGRIPKAWDVTACGELFDVQLGKMMSPTASTGPNQRPYLRNQNVYWDRLDLSDIATMHFDQRDLDKFRLERGDLLACEGRFIGRCALWRGEVEGCFYQKALHRLRAHGPQVTTQYMLFFMSFRFQYDRGFVEQMTHESTIPHLPLEKLLRLAVLVPPRAEQDAVVAALRALTSRTEAESGEVAKLRLLKQGLMEDLLTGRVRVTPLLEEAVE